LDTSDPEESSMVVCFERDFPVMLFFY
jgi:hypothetical protein